MYASYAQSRSMAPSSISMTHLATVWVGRLLRGSAFLYPTRENSFGFSLKLTPDTSPMAANMVIIEEPP